MEVYWYADRNGINNFYVKVTERSSIDLPMTLGLFIEIEPSKLGQWGLLGIFSCAIHNVTLYDSIFACKNILALVSHTMVHCMTLKMLGFIIIIILPPLFEQQRSYDHEKTNRPISTKLSQDLGSCLNLVIFTLNHLSNKRQPFYITLCNTTSNMII